ncbi:MAG: GEVED domain-containing protein [Bacteroidota bacterium]
MRTFKLFLRTGFSLVVCFTLFTSILLNKADAQCYSSPAYCTSISASNVGGYGMGIQNVSLGYSATNFLINNSTASGTGSPIYFNYTNLIDTANPGSTVYYSIKVGNSNSTTFRIYIDYNQDGTFALTAPELVYTSATTVANGIVTGTFVVPVTTTPGSYRIRIASDYTTAPAPCGPITYSAEFEDYTLLVPAPSIDVASGLFTSPGFFISGNNSIGFSFTNISNVTLTSISIGYQLDANAPVTQNLTGLSVTSGSSYTANFSTQLNIPSVGTYNLRAWQTNPNGAGSVSGSNDTICRTVITYCSSALNGVYTIDPAGSGPTNFPRFGAADSALMSCGISGPVLFNVAAGTYNEQVYLSTILGASATNTITFDGGIGNAATRILTYAANSGAPYTVRLDGSNYVTYKNLDIRGTSSTDAWVFHFLNGTNNRVSNCIIEITGAGATATGSNLCAVVVNGSASGISTVTTLANNITVDSCTLNAGYYSVYNSMSTSGNVFTLLGNTLNNAYQYGYYSINTFSLRMRTNTFNLRTSMTSNYGIYLQSCNNSGSDYFEISRNKIINAGMYGIYMNSCSNNGTATNQIYNNMIGGGFRYTSGAYGIYLASCTKNNIYHNSINMDIAGTSGTTAALYVSNGGTNDVRNNHLVISNAASQGAYSLYVTPSSSVSYLDNNNYYNKSSALLISISGNAFTATNYRTSLANGGGGVNSISLDPSFISSTNLHTTNGCNRGANLGVTVDFDGETRSTPPNIGADELLTLLSYDIGVLKINSPVFPLSAGTQSVNVTIKNYGSTTITSATMNYSLNGASPTLEFWSGTLLPCDTANFTFIIPNTFISGVNNLKVYTLSPNGVTDANSANDTAQYSLSPALSGIYTIDPIGSGPSNFPRFGAADTALMTGGIYGPVVFNVAAGTYNEQFTLPISIGGVSNTNSITFQSASGLASSVILSYSATAANNFTLRLSGINNVKFKNMTISALNASYGTALSIINNASSDSFYNVVFNSVVTTSASNQSLAVIYCPSGVSNSIYFDTCRINNGSYGSYFYSSSTSTLGSSSQNVGFNNCDFVNQYSYGIYNQYLDGYKITKNRITTNSTYTAYNGIYNYWIMILANVSKPICSGNKISGAVGGYGIYNYYVGVNSTINTINKPIYANNMIQIGSAANATYGIYDAYSYSADYVNNSVNIGCTQTANTSAAGWFQASNNSLSTIQNNIFAAYNGAPAIRIDAAAGYPTINYNDYYTTGTNLAYVSATAYTTLAAFKTATAKDANSVNVLPNYVSTTDLHISTASNVLSITANPLALTDYDGMGRCATTDIGADHHPANNNIGVSSVLYPYGGVAGAGTRDLKVYVRNFGANVVTSANVRYTDYVVTKSVTWTGILNPCDSVLVTFTGTNQYTFAGAWSLKFYTDSPNTVVDVDKLNDTLQTSGCTGMAGLYTINPSGSGTTNYTSFALALAAMQGCGIGAPVVFNVAAATYTEQLNITNINGTSVINTVTFEGGNGNAATRVLTYPTTLASPHVVRFNNCKYVIFRNINIRSTGATDAWVTHFLDGNNNKVSNCIIEITGAGATATTSNLAAVVANGNATTISTTSTLSNNNMVDSCILNAGYYSVYATINSSPNTFIVYATTFNNAYQYGVYGINTFSLRLRNNVINLRSSMTSNQAVYLQSLNNTGSDYFEISGNKILSPGNYGLYLNSCSNSGSAYNQIFNNMIGGGFRYVSGTYGMYLTSCSRTQIYNNSVNFDVATTGGTSAALYIINGGTNDVRNNHLMINVTNASGVYPLYISPSSAVSTCDNNNYYNRSGSTLVNIGGINLTASNYKIAFPTGGGASSININPGYTSTYDLHVNDACNNGIQLAIVTTDIDGQTRSNPPDIGADEVVSVNNDAGTFNIAPFAIGLQNVYVKIKNSGTNNLTSANIAYSVNGGMPKIVAWTGLLAPCDTTTIVFTGANQYNFVLGTSYTIVAYTSNPNGTIDPKTANDTTTFGPACVFLSGTYTINPLGSGTTNFTSFASAVTALNCGGVSGPVTFNVASGTYTEQLSISAITNSSAVNNVVFQSASGLSSAVTLTFNGTSTNNYTLQLFGATNVKFRNMTISATNTSYGTALNIINNASSDSFYNVVFNGITTTSNTTNLAVIFSPSPTVSNFIYFDTCVINNGAYGSYFSSTGNTTIGSSSQCVSFNNCDFINQYVYGIYNSNVEGIKITKNRIVTNSTNTSYYGMYNYWITINADLSRPIITQNKISGALGGYGIYNYYLGVNSSMTTARRSLIANNMVQIGSGANATYGIYDMYSNWADYFNNSANIGCTQTTGTSAAGYFASVAYGSSAVQNNIFAAYNGAPAFRMDNITYYPTCDYNNFYTNGANLAYLGGSSSSTMAAWRTASTRDANSVNINPNFVSTTDLRISSGCVRGTQLAAVTNDMFGTTRGVPPNIGAHEYTGALNNDIGVSFIITPVSPFNSGTQDVKVRINNYGANIVTSATIKYSVNGGSTKSVSWIGTLNPCDTSSVTFTGANQFNFVFGGSYSLKAYSEQPNGLADANRNNDTVVTTMCPAFSGAFTINPAGSGPNNFTSFAAAANAISCGGVNGPVTFAVSSGTYNEQFTLNAVNGASAINTITFQSVTRNAANVTVSYSSTTTADNYIASLSGCSYVKFANITFAPLGVNYGNAIVIANSANYNTIDSCVFNGLSTTSATSNLALIYSNNTKDNYNTISNSIFNNGAMGIYWYSNSSSYATGNQILKNTFNNQYYAGIYTSYHDYLRLIQNKINASTGYTNYYGIFEQYTYNNTGASQISKNKIVATIGGGYGIYNYYPNMSSNATNRFLVANNMIQINTTTTNTSYGMMDYYSYYIDVMHNTINISAQPAGTSYAFYNNYFFSTTCFVQNNVFVNSTNGAGATSFAVAEYLSTAGTWNNNNYYTAGTNLGQWSTISQATLAAWRTTSSQDAASYNKLPVFVSSTDLHFTNLPCLNNTGANVLTKVPDDIDGNTRTTTPDLGAAEFTPYTLDASAIAVRAPSGALTVSNPYNVVVTVTNSGSTTLTSLVVGYRVNGGTPVTQTLSSLTMNPCDTLQVTFNVNSGPGSTNQQYYALAGFANIKAYTATPNTGTDLNTSNDTTNVTFCTPFSGVYTIDGSLPASSTNFQTFTAAKNALTSCGGITGPVVFNVGAGTYNEQIDLTAITGASPTSTITFDGGAGNAATRILTFTGAASNSLHTLRINSAQYINIRNITIRGGSGTYGWPLHIYGSSSNLKVKNCVIDFAANGLVATNDNFDAVVINNYAASAAPSGGVWTGSNIEIDSNRILGGNNGVYIYGNSTTPNFGVLVRNNRVDSSYNYAMYTYYIGQMKLNNNAISMRITGSISSMGIYLNNCTATATNFHELNGNKIINCGQYGVYLSNSPGQASPRCQFVNNAIGGGFRNSNPVGIYSTSYSWDILQNSVNLDNVATGSSSACLYFANCCTLGSTLLDVRNNIFAVTALGSSSFIDYYGNAGSLNYHIISPTKMNYNIYYKAGMTASTQLFYMAGSYQTVANVIGNGGYNVNSLLMNPAFVSATDLHIYDGCNNGDSLGVTTDADGNARAAYADRGAYEVVGNNDDIGAKLLLQPTVPISPGLQNIQVQLKNYGSNNVYGGTVKYSVNGGAPVSMLFTDTIYSCSTVTETFSGVLQYNFIGGNIYTIKVYTEAPNGNPDGNKNNDTITVGPICVGLSGAFTINPSGSGSTNYTSFTNAINALMCSGVTGPTTFTVAAGTYNEQINIPIISGASSANPVIFDGGVGNAATRILVNGTTTSTSAHTVRISSASNIQLRNLTIRNTNTTYAWPLHLLGNCNNIKVKNCVIEITGTGAVGTSSTFTSVVMNGSTTATSISTTAQQDSIEIDSNIINNGYASIYDYNNGGTANRFRGNTFNNPNSFGIYVYNSTEVKAKNNIINMSPTGVITSIGIELYSCNASGSMMHELSGNKIFDMGQYGIYTYYANGSSANPAQIVNNMIGGGFRNTSAHYGIAVDYGSYFGVWFNSVNSDTATSSANGAINITNSSTINVRNNIMNVSAAGSQELPFYATTAGNLSALNYNNYYKAGTFTNLIYVGNNYTLANYVGSLGLNNNSFSRDPLFTGKKNLHIGNACNNGVAIAGITTDIDANIRNNPPDVGANEYLGGVSDNVGVTAVLAPTVPFAVGSQDISMIVSNLGTNIITNYNVSYSVNGGTPVTISMTDSILPCDTTLIVFTGGNQYNFIPGTSYTIKAYTSLPNGNNDNNRFDDTTTVGPMCPSMNGFYTIDPAGSGTSNYTSFNAAVAALQCGGVSGNVTFTVANGTYNEQVSIGSIAGANDTMRITFQGTSQASTILTNASNNNNASHTLKLNNAPYVNFYNMTIQATGATYGTAVHIVGSSNYAKVKRCLIAISGVGLTSTSSYFIPLLINNSSDITNPSVGTSVTNLEIDSNRILGGYYSVFMYGKTSTPYSGNNKIRRNAIDSSYYYGYYAYYQEAIKFQYNVVNIRVNGGTTGSVGVYLSQCYNSGSSFHDISGNRIANAGQYGINNFVSSGLSASRSKMINNMFGGGFKSSSASGIYMQSADYWDIWNNTVNLDYPTVSNSYAAFYNSGATNLDIRNNIFDYTATTGTGIPFYSSSASYTALNYNNFYNAAGANLEYLAGITYTTSTFVGGGSFNANSVSGVSSFVGTNNLHLTVGGSKGVTIAAVTNDIDGEIRSTPPDLGADEYYSSMDIGVLSVDSPTTATICGQTRNIIVKIKNYGNQPISMAYININVNGAYYTTYTWSGSLGLGATSAQINVGSYPFLNGSYSIAINTSGPNGGTDINSANDSAFKTFFVIPSVTPTITVNTPFTSTCSGTTITFTATVTNTGSSPAYQWRKNGISIGTNDTFYTSSTLANNDSIVCLMTSTANCATPATVVSNYKKMTVGTTLNPTISIAANNSSVCIGSSITFTATPLNNGGSTPHYQWRNNGVNVGTDTSIFVLAVPTNNDSVICIMTSTLSCASKPRDTSSFIRVTVNPFLVPSASIISTLTSFCNGVTDTFTASVVNGGTAPFYQWKKNGGISLGTNSNKLAINSLANNDSVYLVVTSNATCANPSLVTSNKIGVNVIPNVLPTATVTANKNTICLGDAVTFTSSGTNGGSSPSKQWLKNGANLISGVDSFTTSLLSDKDTISLVYTSNANCAIPSVVQSNKQVITVNNIVTPSVAMSVNNNNICSGTSVSFNATPTDGGATPHYSWWRNGNLVGYDSSTFTSSLMSNLDSVFVIMTTSAPCATKQIDTSAKVKMTVNNVVTPSASINANTTSFCQGVPVSFSATTTNGGLTPHYQWMKNGVNVGIDSAGYSAATFVNKDTVYMVLTSNAVCSTTPTANSNKIILTVTPLVTPAVSISANINNVCAGTAVTFNATPVNGGTTPVYQWKINGVNAGPNTAIFLSAALANNDSVSVVLTSSASCAVPAAIASNKVRMFITPTAIPKISVAQSATNICSGNTVTFTATDSNGGATPVHRWFVNGGLLGSDSLQFTTTVNYGDLVKCILQSNAACKSKTYDTATSNIVVKALPLKPVISRSADTLISTVANSYQWYFNTSMIPSATSKKYKVTQNGSYVVTVDSLGCTNASDPYVFNNVGIRNMSANNFISIAPNPTSSNITLNAIFENEDETMIDVYDMEGRKLLSINKQKGNTLNDEVIDLSNLHSGVYMVMIKHGDSVSKRKIVKAD